MWLSWKTKQNRWYWCFLANNLFSGDLALVHEFVFPLRHIYFLLFDKVTGTSLPNMKNRFFMTRESTTKTRARGWGGQSTICNVIVVNTNIFHSINFFSSGLTPRLSACKMSTCPSRRGLGSGPRERDRHRLTETDRHKQTDRHRPTQTDTGRHR